MRCRVSQKMRGCDDRSLSMQPPSSLHPRLCTLSFVGARHIFLFLINQAMSRICLESVMLFLFPSIYRHRVTWCLASLAQPPRLPWCDARTGIVCTTGTHQEQSRAALAPQLLAAAPLPNSIARWTLSRVCGTPSSENVRAYAVVLQTVPTRSSRTAFSSPHLLCQYSNNATKELMIPVISPSTRLDPTRLGAESRTKHDALSETGSECTKALVGLLFRPGPPP